MSNKTKVYVDTHFITNVDYEAPNLYYMTDLSVVEETIKNWSTGFASALNLDPMTMERINATSYGDPKVIFLRSNEFEIGLNHNGTLIINDFDKEWLETHCYSKSLTQMEETLNHIALIKEKYDDVIVWPPEVWYLFPQTSPLDELHIPF